MSYIHLQELHELSLHPFDVPRCTLETKSLSALNLQVVAWWCSSKTFGIFLVVVPYIINSLAANHLYTHKTPFVNKLRSTCIYI